MLDSEWFELEQLTERLPSFPSTISSHCGFKRHQMSCGTSFSWELDSESGDLAGCAKWFNSHGTVFPKHSHEAREWVIVIEGSMLLGIEGEEEKRLLPGQWAVVEPGVEHYARFLEDCFYYAITIPRDPSFPHE